jgi:hypothetical protein
MNIIKVNHTTLDGTETLDVVLADEAMAELAAAIEEVDRLRAALAAEVRLTVYAIETRDVELSANDKEIARLRAALKVIADYDCECFEDDSCGVCLARLALEPT